jgi:hypothetical protein
MGFFNRRPAPTNGNGNTAATQGTEMHNRNTIMSRRERKHNGNSRATHGAGGLNQRPSFGQWLKKTWPDILTMIVMGILGLGVSPESLHFAHT